MVIESLTHDFIHKLNIAFKESTYVCDTLLNAAKTRKQKSLKLPSAQTQIAYAGRVSRTWYFSVAL